MHTYMYLVAYILFLSYFNKQN